MSDNLVDKIVTILENKKALDIQVIDISGKSTLADTMIVASGTSSTHIKSLSDNVYEDLKKEGIQAYHVEGYNSNSWILMDYSDVIVNIFTVEDRELYNLEDLWKKMR